MNNQELESLEIQESDRMDDNISISSTSSVSSSTSSSSSSCSCSGSCKSDSDSGSTSSDEDETKPIKTEIFLANKSELNLPADICSLNDEELQQANEGQAAAAILLGVMGYIEEDSEITPQTFDVTRDFDSSNNIINFTVMECSPSLLNPEIPKDSSSKKQIERAYYRDIFETKHLVWPAVMYDTEDSSDSNDEEEPPQKQYENQQQYSPTLQNVLPHSSTRKSSDGINSPKIAMPIWDPLKFTYKRKRDENEEGQVISDRSQAKRSKQTEPSKNHFVFHLLKKEILDDVSSPPPSIPSPPPSLPIPHTTPKLNFIKSIKTNFNVIKLEPTPIYTGITKEKESVINDKHNISLISVEMQKAKGQAAEPTYNVNKTLDPSTNMINFIITECPP